MRREKGDVIIVSDMLRGFHDLGNLKNPRTALIIDPIRRLLERKTKEDGCLTIFLQDSHKKDDPEFDIFPEHCVEGTEEVGIIEELREFSLLPNSVVIKKPTYCAFYRTGLESFLRINNPDRVIVVGVCSDICVLYTVAGLSIRGYSVAVPADCVETFDAPPRHKAEDKNACALLHFEDVLGATVVRNADEII